MAVYDLWFRKVDGRRLPTSVKGKGKRWQARWRDRDDIQRKKNFATKDAAEAFLLQRRTAPTAGPSLITVGEQYEAWIAGKGALRKSTLHDYERKWALYVEPHWAEVAVSDVKHSEVQAWSGRVAAYTSPGTSRKALLVLSGILKGAVRDGTLSADPTAGMTVPRQQRSDVRALSMDQVRSLAGAVDPHGLVVWTMTMTGVRFGEMAGLRVGDLDPTRGRLRVARSLSEVNGKLTESLPKNGKPRDVPVPVWLVDQLVAASSGREAGEPLLPTLMGKPWRSGSWRRIWHPARDATGMEGTKTHHLRHTFASLAIAAGANVKTLQRVMGHGSAAMTLDLYGHWMGDGLDDIAARFNELS